ncbi:site-specific integrase [Vogesella sp. LIG4]|uniref:tyrosine-type recombinase/integrase n=1 Tax=Vogesella sp. LIG4 TaxID=1192162 RepID=UPI00081F830E|nr:site-specific integrase [Vogesella sp. LIG4]SCK27268.1 Site-specific recombinase XerD [Vogesella sp. LIG4]
MLPTTPPRQQLIRADSEQDAVLGWLAEFSNRPATLRSYRKEAERFMLWLASRDQQLGNVKRQDVLDYERFLAHPHPAEQWIGPAVGRKHPAWKPFSGPLSASSIRHAMTVLGSLFSYLNHAGVLTGNPFRLLRKPAASQQLALERFFDQDCWRLIVQAVHALPAGSAREIAQRERALWVISLLYYSGARRGEAAAAVMGDFFQLRQRWWWRVNGKTGVADIPVNDALLAALQRYRRQLGLAPLPVHQEQTPLICAMSKAGEVPRPLGDKALYLITREIFQRAATLAEDAASRDKLTRASTHWLRHTSASHQLQAGIDLLLVSQNLRHRSIQTTRRYLHSELDQRHDALQKLNGLGEPEN